VCIAVKDIISVTNEKDFAYIGCFKSLYKRYTTFVETYRNNICWAKKKTY